MRISLALDLGSDPAQGTVAEQVRRSTPLLAAAERAGFDSVWAGESFHPRPEPFHLPSAMMVLAHLAGRTTLGLGTGVLLARAQRPDRLALEAALLDQLSDGRLTLGIGLGAPELRGALGGADRAAGPLLDDLLVDLRRLWRNPQIQPAPVRPGGPPLLVGGAGAAASRRAADLADGWYGATNYSDRVVSDQAAAYRSAGGVGRVAINRLCLIHPDAAVAREDAARYLRRVVDYYRDRGIWDVGREPADPAPLLVGTPGDVLRQLTQLRDRGVTDVQLRLAPFGVAPEAALRTIEAIGEDVVPALEGGSANVVRP